jgi:hypothetical protein
MAQSRGERASARAERGIRPLLPLRPAPRAGSGSARASSQRVGGSNSSEPHHLVDGSWWGSLKLDPPYN